MTKRMTVVVSQGQSENPAKRKLEEDIVTGLLLESGVDVIVVPHLYDLAPDRTGVLALQGVSGPMVVLSWLYERAARWILDRNQVRGESGLTLLRGDEDEETDEEEEAAEAEDGKQRVLDAQPRPSRKIYCLDLRTHPAAATYLEEIRRILAENRAQVVDLNGWLGGAGTPQQLERYRQPANDTALGLPVLPIPAMKAAAQPLRIEDEAARRWYPVIDYSRCTNCMECIDFCLFGVYGVDRAETILVEQPDNCRKGCPACSRVCPENAIIFPQHKTPAIAGALVQEGGGLKIDLSRLFGAPDGSQDPFDIAARERDEQLVLAGREAVGRESHMPKRQADKPRQSPDELDSLIDALDGLDL